MELSEGRFVPVFILCSLILEILALCRRNWMEGYYGDVTVMTLSPWRLCLLSCLRCSEKKPTIACFWIGDWSDTGFDFFGAVAHLEYWCLGLLTFALLVDMLDWARSIIGTGAACPVELSKPTVLLLVVTSILSTLSISLFGAKIHQDTSDLTTFEGVRVYFGWPYAARLVAGVLTWAASATAIWCQYSTRRRTPEAEDEDMLMVHADHELYANLTDDADN